MLLSLCSFFYYMATEKYYLDENFEKKIDFYYTKDNEICIRFFDEKEFLGDVDLDLETIEEFILDLTFAIQKIKNEGGNNG